MKKEKLYFIYTTSATIESLVNAESNQANIMGIQLNSSGETYGSFLAFFLNWWSRITCLFFSVAKNIRLELEDTEQKNIEQEKKRKWYDFFRRKRE